MKLVGDIEVLVVLLGLDLSFKLRFVSVLMRKGLQIEEIPSLCNPVLAASLTLSSFFVSLSICLRTVVKCDTSLPVLTYSETE